MTYKTCISLLKAQFQLLYYLLQLVNSLLVRLALEATASPTPSPPCTSLVAVKNGTLAGVHNTAFDQDFSQGSPSLPRQLGSIA